MARRKNVKKTGGSETIGGGSKQVSQEQLRVVFAQLKPIGWAPTCSKAELRQLEVKHEVPKPLQAKFDIATKAMQKAAKEAAVLAAVAEEKALQKTSTETMSKKKRKAMEVAACVEEHGQKLKFCCYKCGSFFHRAKECIHWFGWIAWDAANDCGKLMGLKAKHNGAPTPPFENDKSLRWWLTLNKSSGFGEKVFQSHIKYMANGNKDNKNER